MRYTHGKQLALVILAILLSSVTTQVNAQPLTNALGTIADSYVASNTPDNNHGTSTLLYARNTNGAPAGGAIVYSYLKFNLTTVSNISTAKLWLNAFSAQNGTVTLCSYSVADTNWSETGITYNTRPAFSNQLSCLNITFTSADNSWYELDVSDFVRSEKNAGRTFVTVGLGLTAFSPNTSTYPRIQSREASTNQPRLVCVMTNPPPTVQFIFQSNPSEPSSAGRVRVRVSTWPTGALIPPSLTVNYAASTNSTAIAGTDYQTLSGSIVLTPDMAWDATINITPIDDGASEGTEQIILNLVSNENYLIHPWWPSVVVALGDNEQPVVGTNWFVATTGNDSNPGTLASPFLTISNALNFARYGDTIYVRGGTYREGISRAPTGHNIFPVLTNLEATAGSWANMLTVQNYNNEEVFIKGSEVVTGWTLTTNSTDPQMKIWVVTWNTNAADIIKRSQQVFVDGKLLGHVGWNAPLDAYPWTGAGNGAINEDILLNNSMFKNAAGVSVLNQNTTHMTNWSFYHDTNAHLLYVAVPTNVVPSNAVVEASTAIPFHIAYDHTRLKGLKFRHANTLPVTGGWPGVAVAWYSIIDSCDIQWCDMAGVSARDQSIITNCIIANHGMIGGGFVGTNILVSHCSFLTNHYNTWDYRGEAAGSKNIGFPQYLDGCIFEDNAFGYNNGEGLWFDTMKVRDVTNNPIIVKNNYFHDNTADGVMIEVTDGTRLFNNIAVRNPNSAFYFAGCNYSWAYNNTWIGPTGSYTTFRFAANASWQRPHHVYITNNIILADETVIGPIDPEVVTGDVRAACSGIDNIFYDYNLYLVKTLRPDADFFSSVNLDLHLNLTNAGCSPAPASCIMWQSDTNLGLCSSGVGPGAYVFRLNWAQWQAEGNDVNSILITNWTTVSSFFINAAADDYRISTNSPAAWAGRNLYNFFQDDFKHQARPSSGNFSIGAHEP